MPVICRTCNDVIDEGTFHHNCYTCGNHFITKVKSQFRCIQCRPAYLKPVAAAKFNAKMEKMYGWADENDMKRLHEKSRGLH